MKISFHGAAQTVTGSQHLIEVNGTRILLDCGLYQGKRSEAIRRNTRLPFDARRVDLMVLSHAHIDHSGNIPNLVKSGFRGDIVCTHATRDLCNTMLRDSGRIQEKDAEYSNEKRRRRGEPPIEPIYTERDVEEALKLFRSIDYNQRHELAPGVTLRLVEAGHMLGSAMLIMEIEDHETGRDQRLVFSGDIGRPNSPLLKDPTLIGAADLLIMESTYGDRNHKPDASSTDELEEMINRSYQRGGKILVPAFAVGRTQQVVYELNRLHNAGRIPKLPVFVDSPLATDASEVFKRHQDELDEEAMRELAQDPDNNLFGFSRLEYIRDVEDSKALNHFKGSCVIISASGMMEHGRILHHLKNNVENPNTAILVVGWQGPDTLGRYLVEGKDPVRIFGEEYHPRAEIVTINGLSGHAGADELVTWAAAYRDRPARTFLVHGEPPAMEALGGRLRDELGFENVIAPQLHESFDV